MLYIDDMMTYCVVLSGFVLYHIVLRLAVCKDTLASVQYTDDMMPSDDEDQDDAYMRRMKAEGKERDEEMMMDDDDEDESGKMVVVVAIKRCKHVHSRFSAVLLSNSGYNYPKAFFFLFLGIIVLLTFMVYISKWFHTHIRSLQNTNRKSVKCNHRHAVPMSRSALNCLFIY